VLAIQLKKPIVAKQHHKHKMAHGNGNNDQNYLLTMIQLNGFPLAAI
jgi:hypothetical protein